LRENFDKIISFVNTHRRFALAVRIRLRRTGAKNNPHYRIVVASSEQRRDGRFLEVVGDYHPTLAEDAQLSIDLDRVQYWKEQGAVPSEAVASLIKRARKTQTA
jgi:small subunit ribosomal protein S16